MPPKTSSSSREELSASSNSSPEQKSPPTIVSVEIRQDQNFKFVATIPLVLRPDFWEFCESIADAANKEGYNPSKLEAKNVQLFNATTVDLDKKTTGPTLKQSNYKSVAEFVALVPQAEKQVNANQQDAAWVQSNLNFKNCADIVSLFSNHFGTKYFIHIDDPCSDLLAPNAVHLLVNEIMQLQADTGSLVFFTSRSALVYLIGSCRVVDIETNTAINSPSSTECITLDCLGKEHIAEILKHANLEITQDMVDVIFSRTGGVPRFVVQAVAYIERCLSKNTRPDLRGIGLYEDIARSHNVELSQWKQLIEYEGTREIAVEVLRVATLRVPFSLDCELDTKWVTYVEHSLFQRKFRITDGCTIAFCSVFPLYLERVGPIEEEKFEGEKYVMVIPALCIESIFKNPNVPNYLRLPLFLSPIGATVGQATEEIVARCIRLRVSDSLIVSRGTAVGSLLPFLSNSFIGIKNISLSSGMNGHVYAPKFVQTVQKQSDKAWRAKLQECFSRGGNWHFPRSKMKIFLEELPEDALCHFASMSMSSDLVVRLDDVLWEIQVKGGAQKVDEKMMGKELSKSFHSQIGKGRINHISFLMVCLSCADQTLLDRFSGCFDYICDGSGLELAISFNAGNEFAYETKRSFRVPANMDVIVLCKAGLDFFLTNENRHALLHMDGNLRSLHAACSPAKQRNVSQFDMTELKTALFASSSS